MRHHRDVAVLDVRRRQECKDGHIADAVNIPIHELLESLDEVPSGEVWVHCAGGYRASIVASILAAQRPPRRRRRRLLRRERGEGRPADHLVIWLAIPLGLAIGLSLGALGGGGSILTVPALVYLLDQDPRSATTGSLLIVGITSLFGMLAHARAGRVRVVHGLAFGVLGIAGSWAGVAAVGRGRTGGAARRLRGSDARGGRDHVPPQHPGRRGGDGGDDTGEATVVSFRPLRCHCPQALKVLVTATAVGLLTGFFGVGGGFAVVPALVLSLGFSMPVAVGTSLLVISVNSASALVARLGSGIELDWTLLATFTGAAILGSLLGGRVASRVRPVTLTRAFTVLLVAVAVYTAVRSVPQLF